MIEILVATYNGEKYISQQLDSLLNQTIEDYRILVRDDGSKDGTVDILKEYERKYPDKVVLIQDDLKGGSSAANFMALTSHATADYVCYCDQDDFWMPEKLEKSLIEMQILETRTGTGKPCLVFGDYEAVDENLNSMNYDSSKNQVAKLHLEFNRLLVQNYVTGCLMMLNKPLYSLLGEYSDDIEMHDWWAALLASSLGGISHFDATIMKYRQHGGNVVGVTDVKSMEYRMAKIKDKNTRNKKYCYLKQAKLFQARYNQLLSDKNKKKLKDFIDLYEYRTKGRRVLALINGKYLKSDIVRVLGQFWYI